MYNNRAERPYDARLFLRRASPVLRLDQRISYRWLGNEMRGTAIKKRLVHSLDISLHRSRDLSFASARALLMRAILTIAPYTMRTQTGLQPT